MSVGWRTYSGPSREFKFSNYPVTFQSEAAATRPEARPGGIFFTDPGHVSRCVFRLAALVDSRSRQQVNPKRVVTPS
jgi:hypothetical protein